MASFVKVAALSEFEPGKARSVSVQGKSLAIYNVDGTIHCTDNTCLHRGGPLGEGFLDGNTVTCPWHGWQFDVASGQCKTNPAASISCFEIKVEGDDILVAV